MTIHHPRSLAVFAGLICLGFLGCEFDVPLTTKPTRPIEQKLVGNWVSKDGKERMNVRSLDDFNYVIAYDGDLYRAHHSDVASTPFVSVLHLENDNRKYAFLTWTLSDEGRRLRLRVVSSKVISKTLGDSDALQKAVQKNLANPALLEVEQEYVKGK